MLYFDQIFFHITVLSLFISFLTVFMSYVKPLELPCCERYYTNKLALPKKLFT